MDQSDPRMKNYLEREKQKFSPSSILNSQKESEGDVYQRLFALSTDNRQTQSSLN